MKCSGGHPCSNCRDNAETTPCVYPSRDRQIKLSEHHLNELLKDYERLKDLERLRSGPSGLAQAAVPVEEALESNTAVNEAVRNPLLEVGLGSMQFLPSMYLFTLGKLPTQHLRQDSARLLP